MKSRLFLCILLIIFTALTAVSCQEVQGSGASVNMRFNEDFKYGQYDGREVVVRGYMSTMSPMDGKFIYLMNIPYQNCPFCLPNTTTVVNTIAVYARARSGFEFYDGPIEITGILRVGDVTDEFGYSYPFKIEDAKYTKLDTSKLSENLKIYGALTQDGIISDILRITSQVDFNAFFEMFGASAEDIQIVNDAEFEDIVRRINAISRTGYGDFISIVEDFKRYNQTVNINISANEYSKNQTQEMEEEIIRLFDAFFGWMNKFEI